MIQKIITMNVDVSQLSLATDAIINMSRAEGGAYVCIANVHMCMETFDDMLFRDVVNGADLVIADGKPISWAQQLLGHENAKQVRGQDIMTALCAESSNSKLTIGLYGGSSVSVLEQVINNLTINFPNIQIVYTYSPPFRPLTEAEDIQVVEDIIMSNVDILFVGIGCPKQEFWMAAHRDKLNCTMLGVGAAFDFISCSKRHAPRVVQSIGLEWLYRLLNDPKRLWKRYLKHNPRFVFYFIKQLIEFRFGQLKK